MTIANAQARAAVDAIVAVVAAAGYSAAVAVVDAHGDLVAFQRMDGSHRRFSVPSIHKAYTAATRETTTAAFYAEIVRRSIRPEDFGDPQFTCLPGGIPVFGADGSTIAGIGVTGRMKGRDEEFARAGVAAFGAGATAPPEVPNSAA